MASPSERAMGKRSPTHSPAVLLFAEEPSGLLWQTKAAVRIFHYRGHKVETDPEHEPAPAAADAR